MIFKKRLPALLGIISLLGLFAMAGCTNRYGYDRYNRGYYRQPSQYQNHGYNNGYQDPYRSGYNRGFEHGYADRRAGYNFSMDHDEVFRRGISSDRYVNDRFREGYARGYRDGYNRY